MTTIVAVASHKTLNIWRYGEYPELCDHLHKYIKTKDDVLNVGCGNSKLCMDMYDVGYKWVSQSINKTLARFTNFTVCRRSITNIDTSELVIKQMSTQNVIARPNLKFVKMDACDMSQFGDETFSAIIDKATLDAVLVDDSEAVDEYVQKYWSEIDRVLRVGGRYIVISLLQQHIIESLLKRFALNNWMFRVVRCIEAEEKTAEDSSDKPSLPVFMVIATKFPKLPSKVLEVCMAGDKMIRVNTTEEVVETVLSVQKAAMVCSGIARTNIAG